MGAKQPRLVGDEYVVPSANRLLRCVTRLFLSPTADCRDNSPRRVVSDRVVPSRVTRMYVLKFCSSKSLRGKTLSRSLHRAILRCFGTRKKSEKERAGDKNASCASRNKKRKTGKRGKKEKKETMASPFTPRFSSSIFRRREEIEREREKREKETRRIRGDRTVDHGIKW